MRHELPEGGRARLLTGLFALLVTFILGGIAAAVLINGFRARVEDSARRDAQGNAMAELLFAQLALTLQRHRYATDDPAATQREALLDKLLAALAASLSRPFVLERFCEQEGGSERALRQQFRQQTGMTINHYLRQLRICHAQYLLQHTERLIGDIAMQCGFEDSNYFSVVFSREIGMSPGQWRQRSRAAA